MVKVPYNNNIPPYPFITSAPNKSFLGFVLFMFGDRVSCSLGWPQTCYIAEVSLKFLSLLLQLAKSWEYNCITMSSF